MGLLKLNLLMMKPNRQSRRRRRRLQARNGLIDSLARIKDSPCHPLSSQTTTAGYLSGQNLPEDIWSHIHSLMPMEDAARAACLSRAFARSWRCHPDLTFSEESLGLDKETCSEEEKASNFTSRVDMILKAHSGMGVKKLRFVVGSFHNLDRWLRFAVKPGIEELEVNLSSLNGNYSFPCELLSVGARDSLQYIYLASCDFYPTVRIGCLRSLTRLQFYMVNIRGDELGCLLSNSLVLERLELRYCGTIKYLKVPCLQRLSYLEVVLCTKLKAIESKAPNLTSFRFAGRLRAQLALGDTLQIKKLNVLCYDAAFYVLTELQSSMPNLEELVIHSQRETVSAPMAPGKFQNLKFLFVALGRPAYDYLSLVSFLEASPCLETFILNVQQCCVEVPSIFADPSGRLRMMPEHSHSNLRRVEMINFSSDKSLVELTCHIVESTSSLERLTLDTTQGLPRCSVNKTGRCFMMRREDLVEARRAVLAAQMYVQFRVPSTVEFIVLGPCSQCPDV
ncbi:hypothetical protein BS78_10G069700 [Paspalum vaginatum]|nr:hypothetical protein BS78_10G069700 [Paspalum vaginatum]